MATPALNGWWGNVPGLAEAIEELRVVVMHRPRVLAWARRAFGLTDDRDAPRRELWG